MGMGGGGGGGQNTVTQVQQIPDWAQDLARANVDIASAIGSRPYPVYGAGMGGSTSAPPSVIQVPPNIYWGMPQGMPGMPQGFPQNTQGGFAGMVNVMGGGQGPQTSPAPQNQASGPPANPFGPVGTPQSAPATAVKGSWAPAGVQPAQYLKAALTGYSGPNEQALLEAWNDQQVNQEKLKQLDATGFGAGGLFNALEAGYSGPLDPALAQAWVEDPNNTNAYKGAANNFRQLGINNANMQLAGVEEQIAAQRAAAEQAAAQPLQKSVSTYPMPQQGPNAQASVSQAAMAVPATSTMPPPLKGSIFEGQLKAGDPTALATYKQIYGQTYSPNGPAAQAPAPTTPATPPQVTIGGQTFGGGSGTTPASGTPAPAQSGSGSTTPVNTDLLVAGFTPAQIAGLNMTAGASNSFQNDLNAAEYMTGASMMPWNANSAMQYMSPFAMASLAPQLQQLDLAQGQNRKRIDASATQAGAFGDARQGVESSLNDFYGDLARGDILAGGMNTAYNTGMGAFMQDMARQQAGAGQFGQLAAARQGLGLEGANALFNAGTQEQQLNQQRLTTSYDNFMNQIMWPVEQLNLRIAALANTPYSMSNIRTLAPGNATAQAIGGFGALAGGLGSLFGGQGGGGGTPGSGIWSG